MFFYVHIDMYMYISVFLYALVNSDVYVASGYRLPWYLFLCLFLCLFVYFRFCLFAGAERSCIARQTHPLWGGEG